MAQWMDQVNNKTENLSILKSTLYDYGISLFKKFNGDGRKKYSRKNSSKKRMNVSLMFILK
ncbi:uncharacterized protein RHIMIDRAFT_266002 [Rhizopus microsporus ATCC 52813]|uniref:Uncharacterized protein n=1 Tax=Rhizopus microsporus ATCC 52813 TaxID=1340429 RepID=A0A2G4T6S9_RHIZD|nr:uncharacterized protein RHIMIDRAFT_266002 [Rhizopus microsporus ATCC 52813]PHZ16396.1 hypothetical protein RHIMIDRAFT_266002 [Rhizopus microsporus ATCC 52813]